MRANLDHMVNTALASGSAVPAFTCYDFTTALAVVGAAEEARARRDPARRSEDCVHA